MQRTLNKLLKIFNIGFNFSLGYIKSPNKILQTIIFKNYLDETGWYESRNKKKPVNKNKEAIPWFTYSTIYFLNKRIKKGMKIFEFGSGNSTLWFANKGCFLNTIEHNLSWYNTLKDQLPKNVN